MSYLIAEVANTWPLDPTVRTMIEAITTMRSIIKRTTDGSLFLLIKHFMQIHFKIYPQCQQWLMAIFRIALTLIRPRNSYFLVVANFCYQVLEQVAKPILW